MPNRPSDRAAAARQALHCARRFLLSRQEASGTWRDYALAPGPSDAWTTACVGWTMLRAAGKDRQDRGAIRQAAASVLRLRRPGGWGYNGRTAVDADSSAWAIRFLAGSGSLNGLDAAGILGSFLADSGAARTFGPAGRFGSWAEEHAEVTPMVGLALIAAQADAAVIGRIRRAALAAHSAARGWPAFWWSTPAYAASRNLEFLALSGGIPAQLADAEAERLAAWPAPASPLECAECLAMAVHLRSARAGLFLGALLECQEGQGSWPPSRALCVPGQRERLVRTVHEDCRQLFGTAAAASAIRLWLEACE